VASRPQELSKLRKFTEEQRDAVVTEYASGKSTHVIHKEYGFGKNTIKRWVREAGIMRPARQTPQNIKDEIMRLYLEEFMTPREIGPRVGMTEAAVNTHVTHSGKRRSISEAQALAANKRPYKKGKGGYWQSTKTGKWVYAMSIMEMLRMQQHDNNPNVVSWDRFVPSVDWQGGKYVPDLFVEYNDGTKVVEEVKPSSQHKYEENKLKWEAAKEHFGVQGMRERARKMGGEVAVTSSIGTGTRITVQVSLTGATS